MEKYNQVYLITAIIAQVSMLYLIGAGVIASSQGVSGASLLVFGFSRTHEIMHILNITTVIAIGSWILWGICFIKKK